MENLPHLTLVTGGARSGKSGYAERLARASGLPCRYLATAEAGNDAEMVDRIRHHREGRGEGWQTIEAPLDLAPALAAGTGTVTLLDCATLWLSNHLLRGHDPAAEAGRLLAALAAAPGPVVVVSNEVGGGIVPENALARRFRDEQGWLNQRLAAAAGLVVVVIAGLPLALRGRLPDLP